MLEELRVSQRVSYLRCQLRVRRKMLLAAILGGGTMIAFPAASAVAVIYVAAALGAICMMVWTGAVALASITVGVLIIPVLIILTVLTVTAGCRWLRRAVAPRRTTESKGGSVES